MDKKYRYPESVKRAKAKIKERIRLSNEMEINGLPPDPWVLSYRNKNNESKKIWKSKQPKSDYVPKANSGSFKKGHGLKPPKTKDELSQIRAKRREYHRMWSDKNRDIINAKQREKRKLDVSFKIKCNLRKRLSFLLKKSISEKTEQTMSCVGCSIDELKLHLSKSFRSGMSFDNYGEWHIDHIVPCSYFDFSVPEDVSRCFHYTNLQPLWATENREKSDKILFNQ